MSIESLIDELEDIIENSKKAPLSNKLAVDGQEIKDLIESIRLNMPDELMKARKIASERKGILDAAQVNAEEIIAEANSRAEEIVSETEIYKLAQEKSNEILQQARTQATEIIEQARATASDLTEQSQKYSTDLRRSAGEYVENIVATADESLTAAVNEIRKARMALRNAAASQGNNNSDQ